MNDWIIRVGAYIDSIAANYVNNVVAQLAVAIMPLVLAVFTIWWITIGITLIRGQLQDSVGTVIWKALHMSMIFSVALNVAVYNDWISDSVDGLRDGMASVFAATVGGNNTVETEATIWTAINDFDLAGGQLVREVSEDTSWYNVPVWAALALVLLGQALLTVAALFIAVLTKVFASFFLAVGPLFILGLAFKPTQRFFDGWLGMVINTIVLSWIGLFLTGFGLFIAERFATAVANGWDTVMPITSGLQYLCMCGIFTLMLFQAPGWAAALAGGSSMQTGVSMITQALIVRGRTGQGSAGQSGSNQIARGSALRNLAYQGGNAAGVATRGVAAGAQAMGRGFSNVTRQAAYKLAALRGRR